MLGRYWTRTGPRCSQQPEASSWGALRARGAWHARRLPALQSSPGMANEDTMPSLPEPASPLWGDWTDIEVKAATVIWVNRMVIGLDLCPFALASMPGLRVVVSKATTKTEALDELAMEMDYLVQQPKNKPATTLVVFPLMLFAAEQSALDEARSYPVGDDTELTLNDAFLAGDPKGAASAAAERYRQGSGSGRQGSGGLSARELGDWGLAAQGIEPLGMEQSEPRDAALEAELSLIQVELTDVDGDGAAAVGKGGGGESGGGADRAAMAKAEREGDEVPFWGLYGDVAGGQDTKISLNVDGTFEESGKEEDLEREDIPFWGIRGDEEVQS